MEAAVKSMKYHLRRTLGSQVATNDELCTLLAELEACLNSTKMCAFSDDHFNTTFVLLDIFQLVNHLPNYLLMTFLMLKAIDILGVKTTNSNCNSSGNVGHPTTYRVCNSVNASRGHPLTYNQAILSC